MTQSLRRVATAVCAGAALLATGALAQDDPQQLRQEIESLKKQLQELRDAVKGMREETAGAKPAAPQAPAPQAPAPQAPAPQAAAPQAGTGLSATVFGADLTIYGTLNADAGTAERSGATAGTAALNSLVGAPGAAPVDVPRRYTLRSNSSNLGVRGKKDLAGGISAVFQIESAIGVEGGASTLAGRDTFVGLATPYGTVLYGGNIDSPYKRGVQEKDPFYATGVATQKGILGSPGFNVASVNAVAGVTVGGNAAGAQQQNAGFDARLNNLIIYRSPVFNGLSAEVAYGADEQKSNSLGAQINPDVISTQLRYVMGPIFATYSYERRKDVFGLNSLTALVPGTGVTGALFVPPVGADSTDTANKLAFGYTLFGNTDALLVWERLSYKTNVGAVSSFNRDALVASLAHRFGPHRAIASFGKAGAGKCELAAGTSCSTDGLGASQWAVGYDYTLDKTTNLYVFLTKIVNSASAAYNFGISGAPAAGVGADPQAVALGVRYRF